MHVAITAGMFGAELGREQARFCHNAAKIETR
jgi:hypothetical protein